MKGDFDATAPAGYSFGPFSLDLATHELARGGKPVPINPKAFEALAVLVRNHDRVVEKDELLKEVWPDTFVSEDSLTQSISVLRRALRDDSTQPHYIATIPRRGYRFVAPVTIVPGPSASEAAPSAAPPSFVVAEAPAMRESPRGTWQSMLWLALPAAVILFVVLRTIDAPRAVPNARPIRFELGAAQGTTLASGGVLSPDARHLAFVARHSNDGRTRLWIRVLESAAARVLPGTENAFKPFWSADGQWVAFFADGRLKKVGLGGAPPLTLASVGYHPSGGTWSPAGMILYSDRQSRIYSVSAGGDGKVTPLTTLDPSRQEVAHYAPQFLPDGRNFLFVVHSTSDEYSGTFVASLDTPEERTRILDGGAASVTFAPPDHLVFVRDQTLLAQAFDPDRRRLSGGALSIGDGISSRSTTISATNGGILTFGGDATAQHLVWFDRDGKETGALATTSTLSNPALSPDQRQLLADGNGGIWLIDLERGAPTRVADGMLPAWSADGQSAVFTARRVPGAADVYAKPLTGGDGERLLIRSKEMKLSSDWSRDGRFFVYVASDPGTRLDIWTLPATGEDTSRPFLQTSFNEMQPRLSPDGRWIAYTSDETGTWEVYVQSYPSPGAKRVISVGGGAEPQWTKSGRELLYLTPDGTMMSVDIAPAADALQASRPRPLFRVPISADITTFRNHYVVTDDGQRFLVHTADESTREPIAVVVNWEALVNR